MEKSTSSTASTMDKDLWSRLDAIILQWIYDTISKDILHTIIQPGSTAAQAWTCLRDLFHDNKNSRVVILEHPFSHLNIADFRNASSYCQTLKMLADQLANVGSPVSNQRLVLQMVVGLTEAYNGVASIIQHRDPLPLFSTARSMLILEETSLAKRAAKQGGSALVVANSPIVEDVHSFSSNSQRQKNHHNNYKDKKNHHKNKGGNSGNHTDGG
ncbi:uncharacterized protein LOC104906246 [Beta vulgaris subsp. vulgaris]|uniref:uncharacterized protein LOC104906246 n=1 Tax=Beta vulgaris subsp. vulgaris TaxID=3555 RepID=UPI0020369426|nr:uncharacterized protein LOC104906246 [Beta vulgaris subsp. vulgaris]